MTFRRVTITSRDDITIGLALPLTTPSIPWFREDSVIEDVPTTIEHIQLSVEDVCRIAKALRSEKAINDELEPTPSLQRHRWMLRNRSI